MAGNGTLKASAHEPSFKDDNNQYSERAERSSTPTHSNSIIPGTPSITPGLVTLLELDQRQIDGILELVPGGARNVQDVYPLSSLQEGLLFHRLMDDERDSYVLSAKFELQNFSWLRRFIDALQSVVDRHDSLRSAVLWANMPRPVQVVHRRAVLPVTVAALEEEIDPIKALDRYQLPENRVMNLNCPPLARLVILQEGHGERWYALLQVHHIVCDHQSMRMIIREAGDLLHDRESVRHLVAYRDYVTKALSHSGADEAEAYFRSRLSDVSEPTKPFGLTSIESGTDRIDEEIGLLDPSLAARSRLQAKRAGVSPARLFHAAWALVVAKTSGKDDVVFGTVLLATRHQGRKATATLGMAVNTLPIRLALRSLTVPALLKEVDSELNLLSLHVHTPLTRAQSLSGISNGAGLVTSLLNFRHSEAESGYAGDVGARLLATGEASTSYPLVLVVDDTGKEFVLTVQSEPRIGARRIVDYVQEAMESLVTALELSASVPVLSLAVIPRNELERVLHSFSRTCTNAIENKLAHELFEQQVKTTPSAIALTHDGRSVTYAELNAKANQLAHYLRRMGVAPDDRVALLLDRSEELVIAVLATMKAGGAYLPLDSGQPVRRIEFMLRDAKPRLVLTLSTMQSRPAGFSEFVALDSQWAAISQEHTRDIDRISAGLSAHHLAYVIYTSGSTGTPKGVMVEHGGLANYLTWALRTYELAPGKVVAVHSPLAFDATVTSLLCPLLTGCSVLLLSEGVEMEGLERLLQEPEGWGLIKITPAHLKVLGERVNSAKRAVNGPGTFVIGGEALPASTVCLWQSLLHDVRLVNEYGPTETVVGCSTYEVPSEFSAGSSVSIGRPIQNTSIYILDACLRPVPIGVTGYIYVGGAGVSRGYLNRPEMTAERFIADPFSPESPSRLYRTGDLGRWNLDGTIEYAGRDDYQIKIRGFRVELGDIEEHLLLHEQVKDAVVTVHGVDSERFLMACIVPEDNAHPPSDESIHTHLRRFLPAYMVPSRFVMIEQMPLTPNGKVDRRALPQPEMRQVEADATDMPRGDMETMIAGIWETALQCPSIGRTRDFFELGGHSLLAMHVTARLQSALSIDLPARLLFDFPTIAQLSRRIGELRGEQRLEEIASRGGEVDRVIQRLAAMPDDEAERLLSELKTEARL